MIRGVSSLNCVHVAILPSLSSLGSVVLSLSQMVPQVYVSPSAYIPIILLLNTVLT